MGDKSGIQWTDATWNPLYGCTKTSPGCANCYIDNQTPYRIRGLKFDEKGDIPIQLFYERLDQPLRWTRPRVIFVNSLSDLFHEDVPEDFIAHVFAVMTWARWHRFQVLTKRMERMQALLLSDDFREQVDTMVSVMLDDADLPRSIRFDPNSRRTDDGRATVPDVFGGDWPPQNVRVGPTIENKHFGDIRFPLVCDLGEAGWNTMVSLEPLLGPVTLPGRYLALKDRAWAIVGGESITRRGVARPFHVDWARTILDDCDFYGVRAFLKQLGAKAYEGGGLHRPLQLVGFKSKKADDPGEWPADLQGRQQFPVEYEARAAV